MSVYMPKINYILLIYRNLFLAPIHTSKLLLLNSLMDLLGTNTDIYFYLFLFSFAIPNALSATIVACSKSKDKIIYLYLTD